MRRPLQAHRSQRRLFQRLDHLRNVVVDELNKTGVASFAEDVESLCLNTCGIQRDPFQIRLLQICVCRVAFALAHSLDGTRAILGFLGPGDIGQPGRMSVYIYRRCIHTPRIEAGTW